MAKNLKLKIKNAQLSQALKKLKTAGKDTKPAAKKTASKATPKVADTPASKKEVPEKKVTILRKAKDIREEEERKKKQLEEAKNAPEPTPVEEKPAEVAVETPPKESPPEPKAPSRLGPVDRKPLKPKKEEPAKKTEKPKPTKAAPPPATAPKQPDRRDVKTPRKQQQFRPFDSRDRAGLRTDEDQQQWRRRRPQKFRRSRDNRPEPVRPTEIKIRLPITLKDLAHEMKLKSSQIVQKLFLEGLIITINDYIEDPTVIELIGHEFGVAITVDTSEEKRLKITDKTISEEIADCETEKLKPRAPVIAFMGHVDHGKTSLVDHIRKSNVAGGEAGAITQHIGAFRVHTSHGELAILDTPGHEAFSLMRMRGAAVTDLVILVVAGDEGIKPQTLEAIKHAKEAEVPMVVAINKCDKPEFNADNVYRQLADNNLLPESWGGEILTVNCSATTGEGVNNLLETTALQAEMLDLKANPKTRARGTVIESELHKGLGSVATILVQNGTLIKGDAVVFDQIWGRIKTMHDEHGKDIDKAGPSTPVRITGLSGVPSAGCEFVVVESEREARKLSEERASGRKHAALKAKSSDGFEALLERESELMEKKILPVIIRADVQGSVEALVNSLEKIKSKKIELNIVSADVGEISESDVELAAASGAIIIGFHTKVESHAENIIKKEKVVIRNHDIIYHVVDDMKEIMRSKLDKLRTEEYSGTALVRQTFKSSQLGVIAGCMVEDGVVEREQLARLFRGEELLWEGILTSLKRVKDDVKSVSKGHECGINIPKFNDIQADDEIKTYNVKYVDQDL